MREISPSLWEASSVCTHGHFVQCCQPSLVSSTKPDAWPPIDQFAVGLEDDAGRFHSFLHVLQRPIVGRPLPRFKISNGCLRDLRRAGELFL